MNLPCHKFRHLSIIERAKIEIWHKQGMSISEIARRLGRSKGAISYEMSRYKDKSLYQARIAQNRANCAKRNSKKPSISDNPVLMHRIERMIKRRWSPEIIAHELNYTASHTAIYTIIKTIRPEWKKYLIYRKKVRYHKGAGGRNLIPNRMDISLRPSVEFGDYETDTVVSSHGGRACLGVFVERTTRLYRVIKMCDRSAKSMTRAAVKALHGVSVRSITYDNGTENTKHEVTNRLLNCKSWFCRAYCSGDKGLIENRNRWLRVYLPKGTRFDLIRDEELSRIENEINERPMKCLNWQSPIQAFLNAPRSN